MASAETLRVKGYREFVRATNRAERESRQVVKTAFRAVGEPVRAEAARLLSAFNERSAAGLRVSVTQRGVSVLQSIRKTTGLHPEWGSFQMRFALLPALRREQRRSEVAAENAVDVISDHFDRN